MTVKDALKLAARLSNAGHEAIDAQRQADHWTSFGTNSKRARLAEIKLESRMRELEEADAALIDALKSEQIDARTWGYSIKSGNHADSFRS